MLIVVIVIVVVVALLIIGALVYFLWYRRRQQPLAQYLDANPNDTPTTSPYYKLNHFGAKADAQRL